MSTTPNRRRSLAAWTVVAAIAASLTAVGPAQAAEDVATLRGVVADAESGRPVAGMGVHVHNRTTGDDESATTDSDGRYVLATPPGEVTVIFEDCARYVPEDRGPLALAAGDTELDVTMRPAGSLRVDVTANGKPVAASVRGSRLCGQEVDDDPERSPATFGPLDPLRGTTAWASYGTYLRTYTGSTVRAVDALEIRAAAGKTTRTTIAMVPSARVAGRVLDWRGRPIAGIRVHATNADRAGSASTTTDARGRYAMSGLASGKVVIEVADAAKRSARVGVAARQGRTTSVRDLTVRYPGSSTLSGKVAGAGKGTTKLAAYDSSGSLVRLVATSRGRATFRGMAAGTYRVVLHGTNVARTVKVAKGRSASFGTLTAPKRSTLSGVVRRADGSVAPTVRVTVRTSFGATVGTARTNASGRYSLTVPSGRLVVVAEPSATSDLPPTQGGLTVGAGKDATKDLRLSRAAPVVGRVLDAAGRPVEGAVVTAPNGDVAQTDADGRYRFGGIGVGSQKLVVTDRYVGGYLTRGLVVVTTPGTTVTAKDLVLQTRGL